MKVPSLWLLVLLALAGCKPQGPVSHSPPPHDELIWRLAAVEKALQGGDPAENVEFYVGKVREEAALHPVAGITNAEVLVERLSGQSGVLFAYEQERRDMIKYFGEEAWARANDEWGTHYMAMRQALGLTVNQLRDVLAPGSVVWVTAPTNRVRSLPPI